MTDETLAPWGAADQVDLAPEAAALAPEGDSPPPEDAPSLALAPLPRPRGGLVADLRPAPLAPVDHDERLRPAWMDSLDSMKTTAKRWGRRNGRRLVRLAWTLPYVLVLLVAYSPRGAARLTGKLAAYLYDYDSAQVRHAHATTAGKETAEYLKAQNVRKANLKARWLVFLGLAVVLLAPVLAYLAPLILSIAFGFTVFVFVVKLIPGRSIGELGVGAVVGSGFGWACSYGCSLLPALPVWPFALALGGGVLALGWIGRPDRSLAPVDNTPEARELEKPTAPLVIDALVQLAIPGMTEKTRDQVRVYAPGVARTPRGYTIELELPGGVTAASVMEKREAFAGALRRRLGTVWPSRGRLHPGHLVVFIADQPMTEAPQGKWKVAEGKELDIFAPMPLFTDQQGKWIEATFAYNHFVVGGVPGMGKSFALRELAVAVAFDPRVRIITLDGKGNGDLRALRLVAHGFYEGDEDDEIEEQLRALRAVRQEMRRRNRFLRELPVDENPQSKVTSELVDRYPHLAPIVLLVDECQVYTEHDEKKIKEEFLAIFTDVVKRGRSAAIIPVFCTQKPDATALPAKIADNCSMRLCFKVNGWQSNNQVLGTEAHASGIKATLFSIDDKGIAYLKGDGDEPRIVRTVHGLDQVKAETLVEMARAIRKRKGLLTGYAAGDEAQAEEDQVDLLHDCRAVMDDQSAKRAHLAALCAWLVDMPSGAWAQLDVDALGGMLRTAGVPVRQVKVDGRNSSGVRREDLDVAATSDVNPDDVAAGRSGDDEDGGSVVSLDDHR